MQKLYRVVQLFDIIVKIPMIVTFLYFSPRIFVTRFPTLNCVPKFLLKFKRTTTRNTTFFHISSNKQCCVYNVYLLCILICTLACLMCHHHHHHQCQSYRPIGGFIMPAMRIIVHFALSQDSLCSILFCCRAQSVGVV